MRREIQIGSITWQSSLPTPLGFAGASWDLKPAWVPHAYLLLKATSNPAPPAEIADFRKFRESREFRALTWCRCSVEVNETSGAVIDFTLHEAFHDPGWTPAFRLAECPLALKQALFANPALRDPAWHPQEASDLSQVVAGRHANSALHDLPEEANVLVNAIVKCRPGSRADETCLGLGVPFHSAWLWNEWLLSHEAGQLKLHLRASRYPSHAWYVDGKRVLSIAGIGDSTFPEEPPPPPLPNMPGLLPILPARGGKRIHVDRLALYPAVLSRGAPSYDPQTPNGPVERDRGGPLIEHPNTVAGWRRSVVTLAP